VLQRPGETISHVYFPCRGVIALLSSMESGEAAEGGGGMGLVNMRERAALIGGTLEIETSPGAGTTLYVRVPVSPE